MAEATDPKTPRRRSYVDELPLFPTDAELGRAIMGSRWRNFVSLAPLLEREGLPKIDPLMGGRYWPAVKTHFDRQHGLTDTIPLVPDGKEDWSNWKKKPRAKKTDRASGA